MYAYVESPALEHVPDLDAVLRTIEAILTCNVE
jgi:hypothetical protein